MAHRASNSKLTPQILLVIDDEPYHNSQLNKAPNSNSTRNVMISWLTERNIPFRNDMLKPDLYSLIKANNRIYKIDTILAEHCHTVLRLPPYHPELNPIELIWAAVKNWIAKKMLLLK